ncbi:MAG: hypothetical protein ACOCPX_00315 [Halapricum sp.]
MNPTHIRSAVAAVLAVVITGGILLYLENLAPGLTTGTAMRETLGWAGSPASQYTSYQGIWIAMRAILGLYITVVAAIVTLQTLVTVREYTAEGTPEQ